jgi:hypothetical protein
MIARGFFSSRLKRVAYRRLERIQCNSKGVDCSLRHYKGILNGFCAGDNIPRSGGAVGSVTGEDFTFNFEIANICVGSKPANYLSKAAKISPSLSAPDPR